jgi:peptidoglycan/xylan/chitin deacetylase (PgdA/CDA1 family)
VIISVEHLEWVPPADAVVPRSAISYGPYPRAFQVTGVSRPEYGSRVGVFRLLDVLDKHGITPLAAIDAGLADRAELVKEFTRREAEFLGHGIALSRMITESMSEEEERRQIASSLDTLESATGRRPRGWLGAEYAESTRTVRILGELGIRYVCDWPNDEQPYPLHAGSAQLTALPVAVDLDDVMAQKVRRLPPRRWARMAIESLERLHRDGAETGRLLILNLHAHVSGQPFRIRYVDAVLDAIRHQDNVWVTTGDEIVKWYLSRRV